MAGVAVAQPHARTNRVEVAPAAAPFDLDIRKTLTAHKRGKHFEALVSKSALGEALYQMRRYGWTVEVSEPDRS